MQVVAAPLIIATLIGGYSCVYYRQWFGRTALSLAIGWGLVTLITGVASFFRLLPLVAMIFATAVYAIITSTMTWQVRKDKSSASTLGLSIAVLLAGVYIYFFDRENISLPLRQWSVGSYAVAGFLVFTVIALLVI